MRVTIRNFRGIKSADIDLSRLALIAGLNFAGKSSIAHAVGAALSGEPVPIDGLRKSDAGMLVHAGTGAGSIEIEGPEGKIAISYPQATPKSEGTPPAASGFAVGRVSLVDMDAKARATALIDYLHAKPTDADIVDAAKRIGLTDAQAAKLASKITELGWDGAHVDTKEIGIKLKGQWEAVTGERYGSKKGDSWLPPNWDTDLEAASEDALQGQVTQAREFVEAAIASSAVSEAERAQLADAAGKIEDFAQRHADAIKVRDASVRAREHASDQRNALPRPATEEKTTPCPHCSKGVVVRGSTLAKPAQVDAAENARRASAISEADAAIVQLREAVTRDERVVADLDRNLKLARAAAEKLKTLPPASDNAADLEQAREGQAVAERRLAAFNKKREADRLHKGIGINAQVQTMLAPDGLRLTKLRDAVRAFNVGLVDRCKIAGWDLVELSDELAISYGARPWPLLSESEKYRTRVTLQVAMTEIDRSAALVVDAADILDRAGRNGLMRLLLSTNRPALVCMTLPSVDDVPSLGQRGAAYWVNACVARQVGVEV